MWVPRIIKGWVKLVNKKYLAIGIIVAVAVSLGVGIPLVLTFNKSSSMDPSIMILVLSTMNYQYSITGSGATFSYKLNGVQHDLVTSTSGTANFQMSFSIFVSHQSYTLI